MKKLLLFLIMPFFTACTPSAPKMQTVYEINIDSISEALPELAQIKYVPLETTDSSLIGNIDKILYQNNKYYILDKVEKKPCKLSIKWVKVLVNILNHLT